MKTGIIAVVLLTLANATMAQDSIVVHLNRSMYPIWNYTKAYQDYSATLPLGMGSDGKTITMMDNYKIMGGDYADNFTKFSIAVNTLPFSQAPPVSGNAGYDMYIGHYGADSAFISSPIPWYSIEPGKTFYIKASGREYCGRLADNRKTVTIKPYNGKYVRANLQLYNDSLPMRDTFNLSNGKQVFFKSLRHKHKYIYVFSSDSTYKSQKALDTLKSITEKYSKILTCIIVPFPLEGALKMPEREQVKDWIICKFETFPYNDFLLMGTPNGALFSKDGPIINRGILPSDLGAYIEKLEHKK